MNTRVIQWSSGNVGKALIRSIAKRDNLELAGLYVYSQDKSGQDAGEIAGIGPLGVCASNEVDVMLAADADVVIHTPLPSLIYGDDPDEDVKIICRLLASGKNVITTVGYMYPKIHGPALVERLEEACRAGNSTFHSTGLNPGWMGDLLPLTMSALSSRIDQVYVREITNFEFYPSPEIMFGMMGFGKTDAEFAETAVRHHGWLNGLFRENIQLVADGLGVELDEISDSTELAYAASDLKTAAGRVQEGTIAGQHWEWAGIRGGRKIIVHETVWRMHRAVAPHWPDGDHSVTIEGKPRMQINFDALWVDDGLLATGMHALNAIPYVMAAAPGIQTLLDLPWMMGRGAVR
jgi:4-hydroxy-tetrahydrodipicolinate reductase